MSNQIQTSHYFVGKKTNMNVSYPLFSPPHSKSFTNLFLHISKQIKTIENQFIDDSKSNLELVNKIVRFYKAAKKESEDRLQDGANQKPQYSLRFGLITVRTIGLGSAWSVDRRIIGGHQWLLFFRAGE